MDFKTMSVEELQERRAAISAELDTADDARLDELTEEARAIKEEIEQRKAAEAKRAAIRDAVANGEGEKVATFEARKDDKKMSNIEVRNTPEYIEAFATFCKTGDDTECRALLTENATGGNVPVPTFVGEIVAKRFEESEILRRVRRMNAAGNVKVSFEISAPAAGVHTEGGDPMTEEALTLGTVTLIPKTYKKWVGISDETLDSMSGEAYLRYIYDEIARGIVKAREDAVVAKILAAPDTADATHPAVAKTGAAAGAITDIINARALLSSAARDIVVICTPAQYATYRGLQFGSNYGADPFDGLTVLFNDTTTAPIVGDLAGVLENLPKGDSIQFKEDDRTRMKSDMVDILGRQPAAIEVVGNKFFAKVSA